DLELYTFGDVTNSGILNATNKISINSNGDFTNETDGIIGSFTAPNPDGTATDFNSREIEIFSKSLTNKNFISAKEKLTISDFIFSSSYQLKNFGTILLDSETADSS